MAEKKKKLGRGLDSIFGSNVEQFLDEIQVIIHYHMGAHSESGIEVWWI